MTVKVVDGDLLQAQENIIGHQVNCQAVMGSGVAKALKARYPQIYTAYMEFCNGKQPEELLGQLQIVALGGKWAANLFGQLNYGRSNSIYTDYTSLQKALMSLKVYAKEQGLSVALPYQIGCGLANGDWKVVLPMIEEAFSDYECTLYRVG